VSQKRHIVQILGSSKNRQHGEFWLLMNLAKNVCFRLTIQFATDRMFAPNNIFCRAGIDIFIKLPSCNSDNHARTAIKTCHHISGHSCVVSCRI